MSFTLCLNDGEFGPTVQGCRGDFDFTQKFERIFLSIIPAAVFIAAALARVVVLAQRPRIVGGVILQCLKLAFVTIYGIVQFVLLVLLATGAPGVVHSLSLAASVLVFVASLFVLALSFAEHSRAQRPSTLLGVYVLLTLLFDVVQTRTAWLIITNPHLTILARLLTSSVAVKLVILCLEAIPKTRWIYWDAGEHSPEESSSVFSLGIYYWLNRLFLRGYKGVLSIDDLYPLDTGMSSQKLYQKLSLKLQVQRYREHPKSGLLRDLCRALPGPFLAPIAPRIALIAFKFCQPFFIETMLEYLQKHDKATKNLGYGLIGACLLIYLGIAVSYGFFNYYNQKANYMVRGCLASAVYRKTTQTKLTAADDSAAVTLMSTDMERILRGGQFVHDIWASLVEVGIGCWLLQGQIGAAFVSPVIIILVCTAILAWVLASVGRKQGIWMAKIQNRVGLTSNAISHMKLYKISGITGPVADLIQRLRVGEIAMGNQFRWLIIAAAALGFSPLCLAPVITFAVTSSDLDVNTLFTSLSYIILLTAPLTSMFLTLPSVFAAFTCLQRIQQFLAAEPRVDFRRHLETKPTFQENEKANSNPRGSSGVAFSIEDGSFGWGGGKMTLNHLTTSIPAHALTLVVGPVASGKSTLCKALLGEVPVATGTVNTYFPRSTIGYCEQSPFLYNATLKKNIIGHCEFDQKKYNETIEATLLSTDVALLPQGHDTKIGSNGIVLSGGQKQRVSVARALYAEAEIMIFDDILSGLDNDTEAELFRRVFGPDGIVRRRRATVLICTHSIRHLPEADHIIALGADGTLAEEGSFEFLASNRKYVQSLGVTAGGVNTPAGSDRESDVVMPTPKPKSNAMKEVLEDKSRQLGDWKIYKHYFSSVGPYSPVSLVVTGLMSGACSNISTVWIKYWSEDAFGRSGGFYIGIFGMLRAASLLFLILNAITTLIFMISFSGSVLHKRAIMTVVTAPLKFFTTTDAGVVTNLFSQDMTLLDGELPSSLTSFSIDFSDALGMAFVIAAASPYIAASYPILFAILYFLQMFYLRTSRQMRLLDLEAKSPLYTHFIDTIKGVATIRAFGWETHDIGRNNELLDTSQRPAYLLGMIQQWLMTTMQLIVAAIALFLVALATQLRSNTGLTGASLVTLLSFSESLGSLIRNYTALETSLGAVSRLKAFSETVEPEDQPGEDLEPPVEWPQGGRIDIKNVSASYGTEPTAGNEGSPESPPTLVLKDLTLSIMPGQRVAICGRTGSGKSTLILLLLRLIDPLPSCARNMEIDGVPFSRIDRATLRQRIIAIPQDAVFLPDGSSVRANIDPLGAATEDECLAVMDTVRLSAFVDDRGGLDAGMSADDLSAGQKQLFSLGRAILRKRVRDRVVGGEKRGGLLLLDEVSSSADKVTDRAMQEIIREEFERYTIIMVSHRLEVVMDFFDRVVVLDEGAVVEEGSPRELVARNGSRFGELWAIGNHEAITSV